MTSACRLRLPPGCVTGVGSLPHTGPDEAVAFVAEYCAELPFWPQLPKRCAGEGVIGQGLGALIEFVEPSERPYCWQVRAGAGSDLEIALEEAEAGMLPETAAGFYALERAIQANRFPIARAFKAQIEGPATLAHCLFLDGEPMAKSPEWLERLATFLERQVAWQVRRLGAYGLPVVFVLDEPTLTPALVRSAGPALTTITAAVRRVLDAARREGAIVGIHSCAALPLAVLSQLELDLLSFDAHLPIDEADFAHFSRAIEERRGYLAYGLAPTRATGATVEQLKDRWLALASLVGRPSTLAPISLVTATCGLGLSTLAEAVSSFTLARELGTWLSSYVAASQTQPHAARGT